MDLFPTHPEILFMLSVAYMSSVLGTMLIMLLIRQCVAAQFCVCVCVCVCMCFEVKCSMYILTRQWKIIPDSAQMVAGFALMMASVLIYAIAGKHIA